MQHDAQGMELLHQARLARFVPVSDSDYDPLRKMTAEAAPVELRPS